MLLAGACREKSVHATNEADEKKADSMINALSKRINPYLGNHDLTNAWRVFHEMGPAIAAIPSYRMQCHYLRTKGTLYSVEGKLDSALYYYRQSLNLALKNDSTGKEVVSSNFCIGAIQLQRKNYPEALKLIREAYDYRSKFDTANVDLICLRLAELYNEIDDAGMEKKYLLEGITKTENPRIRTVLANKLKNLYLNTGQRDSAAYYFDHYISTDTSLYHPMYKASKLESQALFLRKQGRYEEAAKAIRATITIEQQEDKRAAITYFNMADVLILQKKYPEALAYSDTAMMLALGRQDTTVYINGTHKTEILLQNADIQEALGHKQAMRAAYQKAFDVMEASADSAYAKQALEIETRYAVKAKDEKIGYLNAANNDARKINRLQRIIIGGCAFILLLSGGLFFQLWRKRGLREKLWQAEMEQRLLRSQMEPHFIFNTLSVLQAFIRNHETEKSILYLNQFARLLRINLENSQAAFVPLSEEIEALSNYLNLQNLRFEELFDYNIHVPQELEEVLVPPMVMQPFVENAIHHGLQDLPYKGKILIEIRQKNDVLHCSIEDNGTGISNGKPGPARNHQSLSTDINRKRLEVLSRKTGKHFWFSIRNKADAGEGSGTIVEIFFPYVADTHA